LEESIHRHTLFAAPIGIVPYTIQQIKAKHLTETDRLEKELNAFIYPPFKDQEAVMNEDLIVRFGDSPLLICCKLALS
jgi:hypothetical protein